MAHKDPEARKRYQNARYALKKAGSTESPPGQARNEHVDQQKAAIEQAAAETARQAVNEMRAPAEYTEALHVVGSLQDSTDQNILKDKLVRELYPKIEDALLLVLANLGLVVEHPIFGNVLLKDRLAPLVERALYRLGPVFEEEIPRGDSLDPAAIVEMKRACAKTGALMMEIGFRKLQMVDPATLCTKDAMALIKAGSSLEIATRQALVEEDAENSTQAFSKALMANPANISNINSLLVAVAEASKPGFMVPLSDKPVSPDAA